jgi:FlaA1/EpsC-like NDP-sugar epimerase
MASTIAGSDSPGHSLTSVPDLREMVLSRRDRPDIMNRAADQVILVTRAAGFIGYHVAEQLLKAFAAKSAGLCRRQSCRLPEYP